MSATPGSATPLSGRVTGRPDDLWRREVLEPQFRHDVDHLLRYHLIVEKVLLTEYVRLGVLDRSTAERVVAALDGIAAEGVTADPDGNLSDLALAVERRVAGQVDAPAWHVDRSRNDLQATVALMAGRAGVLDVLDELSACAAAALRTAGRHLTDPFPGFTHLQAAQVVTPAFHLSAVVSHLLHTARRLLAVHEGMAHCPLGAGAMSGQELPWDRDRMAALLGFSGPEPHALVSVASRSWVLEVAAECSTFAVGASRFVTDLMAWSGSEYRLVELPDALAGISSAMPQKKNYPVLERIRGRAAHLTSWYVDVALTQRNTPYSNTVEVSKESTAGLVGAFGTAGSLLRLWTHVLDELVFRTEHARRRCAEEYLGGFSLANRLTLDAGVPWREAQVLAGRFVSAAHAASRDGETVAGDLLGAIAEAHGHHLTDAGRPVADALDPAAELIRRASAGAAHPDRTAELLAAQTVERAALADQVAGLRRALEAVAGDVDRALGGRGRP